MKQAIRFSLLLQIVVAMGISGIHTNLRAVEARADNGTEVDPNLERSINENLVFVNRALSNVVFSLMDGVKQLKNYYYHGNKLIYQIYQNFGSLDKIEIGNPQDVDGIEGTSQALSVIDLQTIGDRILAITKEIAEKGVASTVSHKEYWSEYEQVDRSLNLFFKISKYKELTKRFEESEQQVLDMERVLQNVRQIYGESPDMNDRIRNFCRTHHCNDLYDSMQDIKNQLYHSPLAYHNSLLPDYRRALNELNEDREELNKAISVLHDEAKKINIHIPLDINQWPNTDMTENFGGVRREIRDYNHNKCDSYETVLKKKTNNLEQLF